MKKKTLQQMVPQYKMMYAKQCLDFLGWKYKKTEDGYENITCCGKPVRASGWIGTEHMICDICGKGMQDMFGLLPAGYACVGIIGDEISNPNTKKHWTPHNIWLSKRGKK